MPELAEVEFYRKKWEKGLGFPIRKTHLNAAKRVFRDCKPSLIRKSLQGSSLTDAIASGKQMLFRADGPAWLGIHLGMTGKLLVESSNYRPEPHDHLVLYTDQNALIFNDFRLFGRLRFAIGPEEPDWWKDRALDVTADPFTYSFMRNKIGESRRPVKAVLLDQSIFPGVGNWMADEILWRARIVPHRPWNGLKEAEHREIWKRARQVCRDALRVIGTDWSTPPRTWLFNHRWKDGGTCPKTGKPLIRAQIAGRTTCYSPAWQR